MTIAMSASALSELSPSQYHLPERQQLFVYACLTTVLLFTVNGAFYLEGPRVVAMILVHSELSLVPHFFLLCLIPLIVFFYGSEAKHLEVKLAAPSAPYAFEYFSIAIKGNSLVHGNFHFLWFTTRASTCFLLTFAYEFSHDSFDNGYNSIIYMHQLLQAICYGIRQL